MRARLLSLAVLAAGCSVASAYAASTIGLARNADRVVVAGSSLVATRHARPHPAPAHAHRPALQSHAVPLDRALAAMVAPVRTVRLFIPLRQTPALHASAYVFPLAKAVGFADTFGAARAGGSWHHGDDLFAPRGTQVLAVAGGVVFSVGWQRLGGRRLWLRDGAGNEFYYAHLDGYSRKANDGEHVHAGEVIGYVGNSGDAELTTSHLHFEIHPASLLGLGYDGAVDPTTYLRSWKTPANAG